MERENVIQVKSYAFALKAVYLCQQLVAQKEYVLSKQLLKSATSIGANVEEGIQAQSKADFVHKFSIAQKEIAESHYWLRLLRDSGYLSVQEANEMLDACTELQRIMTAILRTLKGK